MWNVRRRLYRTKPFTIGAMPSNLQRDARRRESKGLELIYLPRGVVLPVLAFSLPVLARRICRSLALVAPAALVEFICLTKAEDSILAVRPRASATTAIFLLAIWIHLGYLIWACTVIVDRASAFFGRRVREAAQTVLALSVLGRGRSLSFQLGAVSNGPIREPGNG